MKPFALAMTILAVLASLPSAHAQTGLLPPMDLEGHYDSENHTETLTWDPPLDAAPGTTYNVYMNDALLASDIQGLSYNAPLLSNSVATVYRVTARHADIESPAAIHVVLLNGFIESCNIFIFGPSPVPPYIGQIDWDCLWSILNTVP